MDKRQIVSNKQVKLEIEIILNRKLFQSKTIDKQTYEIVQDELLKEINKEFEKIYTWTFTQNIRNYIILLI